MSRIIEDFSINKLELENLDEKTLQNLLKHEFNGLIFDVIAIILALISFYFIAVDDLTFLPNSMVYNFNIDDRLSAIYTGYYLAWSSVIFIGIRLFHELLLPSVIEESEKKEKSYKLSVKKGKNQPGKNSESAINPDLEFPHFGKYLFENPLYIIIFLIVGIALNLGAMEFYLPYTTRFPSYIALTETIGQISEVDLRVFIMIFGIFIIIEIFCIVFTMFGNYLRRNVLKKIIFLKTQQYIPTENECQLNQNENFSEDNTKISKEFSKVSNNGIGKDIEKIKRAITEKINPENQQKSKKNIFNSTIEEVRNQKLKEIQLKKKIAYLREQEKLLLMIQEEKMKNIYPKNEYKKYIKELRSQYKLSEITDFMQLESQSDDNLGYKIIDLPQKQNDVKDNGPKSKKVKKTGDKKKLQKKKSPKKTLRQKKRRDFDFR